MKKTTNKFLIARKVVYFAILVFAIVFSFRGFYKAFAWTDNTATPPNSNVSAPINTGSGSQGKIGNFGIGTSNPGYKLDVVGSVRIQQSLSDKFYIGSSASPTYFRTDPNNGYLVIDTGNSGTDKTLYLNLSSTGNISMVNGGGKVGIGTTSPSGSLKLDVEGAVGATQYCDQNGANCKTITDMAGGTNPGVEAGNYVVTPGKWFYVSKDDIPVGSNIPERIAAVADSRFVYDRTKYSSYTIAGGGGFYLAGSNYTGTPCGTTQTQGWASASPPNFGVVPVYGTANVFCPDSTYKCINPAYPTAISQGECTIGAWIYLGLLPAHP